MAPDIADHPGRMDRGPVRLASDRRGPSWAPGVPEAATASGSPGVVQVTAHRVRGVGRPRMMRTGRDDVAQAARPADAVLARAGDTNGCAAPSRVRQALGRESTPSAPWPPAEVRAVPRPRQADGWFPGAP